MSIIARCECGNRTSVADVMAGKSIRCSKCGAPIDVPMSAALPAGQRAAPSPAARRDAATPTVHISAAMIALGSVSAIIIIIGLTLYLGPWTVGKKWEAMSSKANDQVTDVVQFALRAYLSEHGGFDAAHSHNVPMTQGQASFVPPMMAFSLPRKIIFLGKTNQGNYTGTYDTTNGEIEAKIETGGTTLSGLVDIKKATGEFRITGREKDGNVSAECEGEPLTIVMSKVEGRE